MPTAHCRYAKSDMTPCVLKDGAICFAMDSDDEPICVGCEHSPKFLGVPRPPDWEKTVADYKTRSAIGKSQ
jgi:hypothetical protein